MAPIAVATAYHASMLITLDFGGDGPPKGFVQRLINDFENALCDFKIAQEVDLIFAFEEVSGGRRISVDDSDDAMRAFFERCL